MTAIALTLICSWFEDTRHQERQRLPVTRTIQAKLLIEAKAPVDIDEVIDALGPGIKVLDMSTNYRKHSGDGVVRYINIETVPANNYRLNTDSYRSNSGARI